MFDAGDKNRYTKKKNNVFVQHFVIYLGEDKQSLSSLKHFFQWAL